MIGIFSKKFPKIDPGFIIHSLTNFDEADNQFDPDVIVPVSWLQIKDILSKAVKDFTKDGL